MRNWWENTDSRVIYMNPNTSGISMRKPHPHALHAQCVVVAPSGRTGILCHLTRRNWTSAGDDQKYHDSWLHMLQNKAQESPWHHIQTHTHFPDNHMESFKVSLGSRTPRVGQIPTTPQTPLCLPDITTRRYQPLLTFLCGTCSRTQGTLIPSIPTSISTHSKNP